MGMLSGAHTVDNGSFDRLIWHIKNDYDIKE